MQQLPSIVIDEQDPFIVTTPPVHGPPPIVVEKEPKRNGSLLSGDGKKQLGLPSYSSRTMQTKGGDSSGGGRDRAGWSSWVRWLCSRLLIFSTLLLKWIGMVLLAAFSLGLVAAAVFFSIFVLYQAIGLICGCQLNEGFIVLISLILLPILILLTSLCCNNSCEKYRLAAENGKLQSSKLVYTPEDDILLCGTIVVQGTRVHKKSHQHRRRKMATSVPDSAPPSVAGRNTFARDVANVA